MMCLAANDPNMALKMTNMAGGPSQLADIALAILVRQWVAKHLQNYYRVKKSTVTIWTSPVFKWSKVVRFANGLVFEWHLNTGQKSPVFKWLGCVITIIMLRIAILMYYHLKSGPDFKWFNHLKTRH